MILELLVQTPEALGIEGCGAREGPARGREIASRTVSWIPVRSPRPTHKAGPCRKRARRFLHSVPASLRRSSIPVRPVRARPARVTEPDISGGLAKRRRRRPLCRAKRTVPRTRADSSMTPRHSGWHASQAHGCLCLRSPDLRFALRPSRFTSSENPPNLAELTH